MPVNLDDGISYFITSRVLEIEPYVDILPDLTPEFRDMQLCPLPNPNPSPTMISLLLFP